MRKPRGARAISAGDVKVTQRAGHEVVLQHKGSDLGDVTFPQSHELPRNYRSRVVRHPEGVFNYIPVHFNRRVRTLAPDFVHLAELGILVTVSHQELSLLGRQRRMQKEMPEERIAIVSCVEVVHSLEFGRPPYLCAP